MNRIHPLNKVWHSAAGEVLTRIRPLAAGDTDLYGKESWRDYGEYGESMESVKEKLAWFSVLNFSHNILQLTDH